MCIIINAKKGSPMLSKESFDNSANVNQDGFGIMYAKDGEIVMAKSMVAKDIWDHYSEIHASISPVSDITLHFRIGTSGGNNISNCHPFYVGSDYAFCHNGMLSIKPTATKSDTVVFNESYLTPMVNALEEGAPMSDGFGLLLGDFIGVHNKFVIMDKMGSTSIINESRGHSKDGFWYSNYSYESRPTYITRPTRQPKATSNVTCACCSEPVVIDELIKLTTALGEEYVCQTCIPCIGMLIEAQSYGLSYGEYLEDSLKEMDDEYEVYGW